jgi:hypothetical protein
MTAPRTVWIGLLLLCGCRAPDLPQSERGGTHVGVPTLQIDAAVLDEVQARDRGTASAGAIRLPDRLILPAAYRLMLVDGCLTLERETGPQSLDPGAPSIRILSGAGGRDDLSYRTDLLPREWAAEIAADHESVLRMDHALEAVMQRSHELARQAAELESRSKRMAELLVTAEAHGRVPVPAAQSVPAGAGSGTAGAKPP